MASRTTVASRKTADAQKRPAAARETTRGGWIPTGTSADRRATVVAAPGAKATRTRERLLDAARVVFARHGYLETTVEHIITEAGVSRGSFYTYFESKTDLFRHLASTIDRNVECNVVGFDRPRGGDPIVNLATSTRNYLAVVRENADLYRLVDQVAASDDEVRKARLVSHQKHVSRVSASIRRWQARGWADPAVDVETTAAVLVSMLSSTARWMYVDGDAMDDERAAMTLTALWSAACGLARPGEEAQ